MSLKQQVQGVLCVYVPALSSYVITLLLVTRTAHTCTHTEKNATISISAFLFNHSRVGKDKDTSASEAAGSERACTSK